MFHEAKKMNKHGRKKPGKKAAPRNGIIKKLRKLEVRLDRLEKRFRDLWAKKAKD